MFDLSKYMTAEERIELFASHYPTFRMSSQDSIVTDSKTGTTFVVVKVAIYKDTEDKMPWIVGIAAENLMTPFAYEKAETSAYARAITNTGDPLFSTTKDGKKAPRANREEMVKVAAEENDKDWENFLKSEPAKPSYGRGEHVIEAEVAARESVTLAEGVELLKQGLGAAEIPQCAHGSMEFKSGTNKQGKPYSGYVCPSKNRNDQCKPVWGK